MSHRTLGIDLGPNSIGWALVDETGQTVVAAGVRVFPEGVDRDQSGGEVPKNAQRRLARAMRRQIARRARRKRDLAKILPAAGLLPDDPVERQDLMRADPYALRKRGLDEALTPSEFGRVLVHLNQRRGFLSNRKTDSARRKEDSATLAEISALAAEIAGANHRTLGEHLAAVKAADSAARIRGKHTRRDMFVSEFDQLWTAQSVHHPKLLTDELQTKIRKIIFYQRKMYWPKSAVGKCSIETKERRCPRADRVAQRFRLLQEVNNLRVIPPDDEPRPLTQSERERLLRFLSRSREKTFDDIRKHLGLLENCGFNLQIGERRKLLGMPTDALLAEKKHFGGKWHDRPEEEKNAIVRALIDTDDDGVIRKLALEEWGLSADAAERLVGMNLPDGYAAYSRKAMEKLLPFLEQGLPLVKNLEGEKCALEAAGYLRPDQRVLGERDLLPQPPEITNPIVRQALHEVRKVVNAIVREYGKPDAVHIELAREVRGNAEYRRRMSIEKRDREARREKAAARIEDLGHKATRAAIDRYLLWEEQGELCMYSTPPRTIALARLFGGEVDIDHILPYSRSLDDSLLNKVVCFRTENTDKGNQTPYEWLAAVDPAKFESVLQRAAKLPIAIRERKRIKFTQKTVVLDEFISRQLVDTAYLSRQVADYVRCLGADVVCTKGQLTAELRYQWGLNGVLRDDDLNVKNREDHRHHAVDAIVIALTNRSRLQQLARSRGRTPIDEPWNGFRAQVERVVNEINVSHRVSRGVCGQLHEETIYGPTFKPRRREGGRPWAQEWLEKEGHFVYRKPLELLTPAMVEEIRDPAVRRIVVDRLAQFGIEPGSKKKIPKEVWNEPLYLTRKPGRTTRLPTRIRKVRLVRRDLTIQPIREGTCYVKPGNTHHIAIFEIRGNGGKTRREMVSVSMLEAMRRVRNHEPLIQRTHPSIANAKFVMSLSRGELVLARFGGLERLLCYRTSASTQGQIYFADHRDARKSADIKKFVATANTLKARKVTVDPLGRLRNASD